VKTILYFFLISVVVFLSFSSCHKKESYPLEPVIAFKNFEVYNDSAILFLDFTDGDGDIGLTSSDVAKPYDANLFLTYYEKQEGVFKKIDLPLPFSYRIPIINKSNKEKPLKGTISVNITPTFYNPFSQYDTLRFDINIVDRALNLSNTISTPEIVRPQ
jgi:hypothetical protein